MYLVLLFGLFVPMLVLQRRASADEVDASIRELRGARAYKTRLSAAMFLARQRDPRAVFALARAVTDDPDSTVRRLAALSLARLAQAVATSDARSTAVAALDRARRDRDRGVRRSAQLALERLNGALADTSSSASRIFVHVDMPADQSRTLPSGSTSAVYAALRGSLRANAPDYEMASGVLPTRAELASRKLRGFSITARVARIAVQPNGNHTDVSCTVSLRVGPWTGRDGDERLSAEESASATGNGRVSASRKGASRAAVDCAVAVAEELAARQVVPFLRRVAATP
ncbi:MAG TPA: HEAT repeat domain-containing protein [Kofleriaceae bacterium]|nr:HEAT repeat domain-containing protein [Kofleriaceae bacterium]